MRLYATEAMQWIKEVELVDSVDDLRFSSSIRRIPMPDFEVLDARIASALFKIIHNSHFNRKISLEEQKAQKQDRFLQGGQIAYLIYEQIRVTGPDGSVENCTNLFTVALRNDGTLLSMTKIPPDDARCVRHIHSLLPSSKRVDGVRWLSPPSQRFVVPSSSPRAVSQRCP